MRRELRCFTTKKNQVNTKEDSNVGNKGQKKKKKYKAYRKQIAK